MSFMDEPSSSTQYIGDSQLQDGIALARGGEREQALGVFRRIIQLNPEHEQAWLWLAWVAESREEARRYLKEARILLPSSPRIAEALRCAADATDSSTGSGRAGRGVSRPKAPHILTGQQVAGALAQGRSAASTALLWATSRARAAWRLLVRAWWAVRGVRFPSVPWARLRPFVGPTVSLLCVAALAVGVLLIRQNLLSDAARVMAEVLPTPNPLASPPPAVHQLLEPLWRDAELASTMAHWPEAIDALERIRALDQYSDRARRELALAHYQQGLVLSAENMLSEARAMFDEAVRADASCEGLLEERRVLDLYLKGVDAYWTKEWKAVVSHLSKVNKMRPGYKDTQVMLGQGYYEVGIALQGQREWFDAVEAMENCLRLLPSHTEAPLRLAELQVAITPPRRIEVSLSQFTVSLYEDDQAAQTFSICHGRASAPTLPGRYEVKTKLPSAYGSAWDLDMPFWLGIYDAGGSENGLHALPILSSGVVVWRQAIGTPCSYGCIVLDTPDAEYMYNWAEIGTVVYVRR